MLIKSPDDYSKRLRLLTELQHSDRLDAGQKHWLAQELRRLAPGVAGERDAAYYLDLSFSMSKNHAVLHDLRLEAEGQVAQIDHLVIDRTFTFFLLETKSFKGNLRINAQGEFSVEYPGERHYGIESPMEQSRRHETVLRKVLEHLGLRSRWLSKPKCVHVVMIHPKGIIHRPPAKQLDTSHVIKADQFATWHNRHIDAMRAWAAMLGLFNIHGRQTVREWGEKLKAEHRPVDPLVLPGFMKPQPVAPAPSSSPLTTRAAASESVPAASTGEEQAVSIEGRQQCAVCGKSLTEKVAKYCLGHAERLGYRWLCFDHQPRAPRA